MGAPKQKWTAEEEAALKAGVLKHGSGKWRTILKDPEFSGILYSRSNVDLKDKWRNMCVMPTGSGSREKSKAPSKRVPVAQPASVKQEENPTSVSDGPQSDEEMAEVKPLAVSSAPVQIPSAPKRSVVRLDKLVLEAITNLKDPDGSNKTSIASYIEDQYWAPPDFKRVLSAKLKFLTSSGKLIRVKRNYQIPSYPAFSEKRRNVPMIPMITQESRQLSFPKIDREELNVLKSQIDLELAKMRNMTPQEAAAAAARAVAEAESAIALAEEAAREADEAEADADAAQAFAAAATKMLRGRSTPKMMMRA
ncbi:hypothetical protein RND81_05G164100 [Saponaria officinalis]|uniref:MYB transcription factor n=1 Tax=Saponaria officinalis TaxID=3572 RepID=A0AAW1KT87_SAPOF